MLQTPLRRKRIFLVDGIGRGRPAILNSFWPCSRHYAGRDDSWLMKYSRGASGTTKKYTWKAMPGRLRYIVLCVTVVLNSANTWRYMLIVKTVKNLNQCALCGDFLISLNNIQRHIFFFIHGCKVKYYNFTGVLATNPPGGISLIIIFLWSVNPQAGS